jgi:hypothetical protein
MLTMIHPLLTFTHMLSLDDVWMFGIGKFALKVGHIFIHVELCV